MAENQYPALLARIEALERKIDQLAKLVTDLGASIYARDSGK